MLYVIGAVLTTTVVITGCGWWRERRALLAERAARRIGEAALLREFRVVTAADQAAEAVQRAADEVLDGALARHYQHHKEGDSDG
ncbi:hypothetical protein TPA0910_86820 [Streptomyces hygroscopicus subsp. sporocinereus]|uniref:Secreted protein n=1 Tax=Streptomyces hygroscopicus TaxID=1912 RepID=A0ABQ3UF77_STRHY|nr:hypothetical protein [Streptomyces hygroscopicus]GHJ34249.1 hypothetical protein TPA0910_86820 [Streptomyces hygroscopicus]